MVFMKHASIRANSLSLMVVEGYMDVIALHQHGITQAVATLGTAVTAKQVQKCLRYVNHLIFCFDGDRAGRQAAWKALTIALPLLREGIHIHFLFLPETEDPDSLVRKIGADAFSQQLEQALPLPEVFFKELKNQTPLNSPADKAHLGQQAAQYLNTMPHGLFRQLMYEQLASELQTDATTLNALLQPPAPQPAQPSNPQKLPAGQRRAQHLLMPPIHQAISLLLKHPPLVELIQADEFKEALHGDQTVLLKIIMAVREQPTITIGELLAQMDSAADQQLVAKLAAREFGISPEEMKAELLGALSSIRQHSESQEIQALVEKAKKSQLNFEEKRKLQTLLAKLKKDASER